MQAALIVECTCGAKLGNIPCDTADLTVDWELIASRVSELLDAHRRGFCRVYNPTGVPARKVHLRSPRFGPLSPTKRD